MMKNAPRNLVFVGFFLFHVFYFLPSAPVALPNAEQPLVFYSYEKKDPLQNLVLQVIDGAKKSLYIATFTLTDPKVIDAIRHASERGVDVFVAVDKKGFKRKRESLGDKTHLIVRPIKGLMHQKWIIADETLSFVGSANLTADSLRHQHNHIIGIYSSTFAKQLIQEAEKKKPSYVKPIGDRWKTNIPPYTIFSWTSPKNSVLRDAISDALDEAKESLEIALFTFTEKHLLEKVIDAKQRGVKVIVLLDRGQGIGPSYKIFIRLLQAGIPVGLSQGKPILHHKMVWIDRTRLFTGSFNWTRAALAQNEELIIFIEGGTPIDPFWQGVKRTWEKLEASVEWQRDHDWLE
jgi:phosphatidylserine/phosphatidylglycerophosphate/cardiolipin synthase-like enzyme